MDPELAALLGTAAVSFPAGDTQSSPDYSSLFGGGPGVEAAAGDLDSPMDAGEGGEDNGVELGGSFPEVTKKLEDMSIPVFNDPNYYKTALSNEGDIAQRFHGILQKFLNARDPKDRGVFRQQIVTVYWDFLLRVAKKAVGKLPDPKKFLLRYGILHPAFLGAAEKELFSKIVVDNGYSEPIYYLDEWLKAVGNGTVRPSTTDEVNISRANVSVKMKQLLDKAVGKRDGLKSLLKAKDEERMNLERTLQEKVGRITEHYPLDN
ncbi:MAG: hypothetical protein LBR99_02300, partial [Treponema sp.]|nr:hypothetical protein [Treponema sp.]